MATRGPSSLTGWRRQATRRIKTTRKATLALVARVPQPEMLEPRTQGRWSVKDVLAHLVSCDEETILRFRLIARGRADRIHWFESMADADRFNARSVTRLRRVGLRALLRRMARVHAELIESFQRLPARSLHDPTHAYTVVDWLPTPGWSHEREHIGEVRAWWQRRRRRLMR